MASSFVTKADDFRVGGSHRVVPGGALPSETDVASAMARFAPVHVLRNVSKVWIDIEYGGLIFFVPPDLGERDPETKEMRYPTIPHKAYSRNAGVDDLGHQIDEFIPIVANGRMEIRDRVGDVWVDRFGQHRHRAKGHKYFDAADFIKWACDKHGHQGITAQLGSPLDEYWAQKARAQAVINERRKAEQTVSARAEFLRKWDKDPGTKGRPYPPPRPHEQEAQEILDSLALQSGVESGKYVCVCGHFQSDVFAKYSTHMKAAHRRSISREEADKQAAEFYAGPREYTDEELGSSETDKPTPKSEIEKAAKQAVAGLSEAHDEKRGPAKRRGGKRRGRAKARKVADPKAELGEALEGGGA